MLENNFNVLDNDFVTLWSKYLTSGNLNLDTLAKLAELGQVNAIQSYYLAEDEELMFPNNTIAKNCENLPNDFNGRYAKFQKEYGVIAFNRQKPLYANEIFLNKDYSELAKAIMLAKIDYEENGNVMSGERYLEMIYSNLCSPIKNENNPLVQEIRGKLVELYERMGEPQYAFALGKNMIFFADSKEMKEDGRTLLKELANREYSKKLNKYIGEIDRVNEIASSYRTF